MNRLKLYASLALLFVATPLSARAQDVKTYPGSFCVAVLGTPRAYDASTVSNTSSAPAPFDCPIVKDGALISNAFIRVRDLHPTQNVTCSLITAVVSTASPFPTFTASVTRSTTGSASGWQKLTFSNLPSDPEGYAYFSCSLPAASAAGASGIGMYWVEER